MGNAASATSTDTQESSSLDLLVLDLNGVLVSRVPLGANNEANVGPLLLTIAKTRVHQRRHTIDFLAWALARFHVAIWTSAKEDTAAPILRALNIDVKDVVFVWGQSRCNVVPSVSSHRPLITKHIARIRAAFPGVNRIALVDDTPEKVVVDATRDPNEFRLISPRDEDALAPDGDIRAELNAFLRSRASATPEVTHIHNPFLNFFGFQSQSQGGGLQKSNPKTKPIKRNNHKPKASKKR